VRKSGSILGSRRKLPLDAVAIVVAAAIVFGVGAVARVVPQNTVRQTAAASANDPKFAAFVFDVASIKLRTDNAQQYSWVPTPDGFSAKNAPLASLISWAFLPGGYDQLAGAPGWVNSERYDVDAKFDPAVADALQKLGSADRPLAVKHALQLLLKERANLVMRVTAKEVSAFDLVIGKNGTTLKDAPDPNEPGHGGTSYSTEDGLQRMTAKAVPIWDLVARLSMASGRPVFDKTGLTGLHNFSLLSTPQRMGAGTAIVGGNTAGAGRAVAADPTGPTLQDVVEEKLGLKLVPSHGQIRVFVIDHIERPSGN
jgi:uncharacterized protein (TIGR03435 family)